MSAQDTSNDIVRVRTFQQDAQKAAGAAGVKADTVRIPKKKSRSATPPTPTPKRLTQAPRIHVQEKPPVQEELDAITPVQRPATQHYIELEESIEDISAHPTKASLLSDEEHTTQSADLESLESGTIIRDTKRKRFRLIPALIQAIRGWFTEKKEEYEESRRPKQLVTTSSQRLETIKKAKQSGTQAPHEDYSAVSEYLKEVKRTPVQSSVQFKEKEEVPAPHWTHTLSKDPSDTPEVQPQLKVKEEKTTPTLQEDRAAAWNATHEQEKPADASESALAETETPSSTNTEPISTQPQEFGTAPSSEPETPAPEEVVENEEPIEPPAPIESAQTVAETPLPQKEELEIQEMQQGAFAPPSSTVRFPVRTFLIVVLFASALGVGASLYYFGGEDEPIGTVPVYRIPSLIQAQQEVPVPLADTRAALLEEVRSVVANSADATVVYPTYSVEGTTQPASADQVLQVLQPRMPGSFLRSIESIALGGIRAEPFVIIRSTSFDTAFAGMLEWERTVSPDLSPLFGPAVSASYDPHARTVTQIRDPFFSDIIAANRNARLLVDESGTQRIVYGFIDQHTILITTTAEIFQELIPLVN